MFNKNTVVFSIIRLWKFLPIKWKFRIITLLVFMFISGIAEMVTLGSVVPFLAALTDSSALLNYPYFNEILQFFNIQDQNELISFLAILFCTTVVISASIRLLISRLNLRWCYELIGELAIDIFTRTLRQPYLVHTSRNSSEIVSGISQKTATLLGGLILPSINSIQLIILVGSIIAALVLILPLSNIAALASFALIYLVISFVHRGNLDKNSKIIALQNTKAIKILQESLQGIKDIILGNHYDSFVDEYAYSERAHRSGLGRNAFIAMSPRFIVEALGIILIVLIAYTNYVTSENQSIVLPAIGALALGAQRMLPYLQQLYAAYAAMIGNRQSVVDALDLLSQSIENNQSSNHQKKGIGFEKSIELRSINFQYQDKKGFSIKDLNLTINKGEIVGIIGTTGGGKTTLIDILMGLIQPDNGDLLIDGKSLKKSDIKSWHKNIFHVPQQIFLADVSIKKNIALGQEEEMIAVDKIIESATQAELKDYVENLPEGYETNVGEGGVQLSGGQRQRIGIARALYKGGSVLILDEATNALDMKTENNIIKTIKNFSSNITVIIIAHNLDTIKDCEKIVIIDKGQIIEQGNFIEIRDTKSFKEVSGQLN